MRRAGFTIIEVILFLAISGLLLTMTFAGSGIMARNARFSDTVNSFHSQLQRQYEEVASGVNVRTTSQGCSGATTDAGTDNCLLLGKVVSYSQGAGSGFVRYVTGLGNVPDTGDVYTQIAAAAPNVRTVNQDQFDLLWGAIVDVSSRASGPTAPDTQVKPSSGRALVNNIAFLRAPNESLIVPYYFRSTGTAQAAVQTGLTRAVADAGRASATTLAVCIRNTADFVGASSPRAAVVLGSGVGSAGIETNFSPTVGAAGIC